MSFQIYQAQGLRIFAGNTATCANYTGNAGEISINTETKAVYVHDGLTAGGTPLTTASEAEMLGMTLGQLANVYLESQSDKSLLSFDLNSDSWKSIEGLKIEDLLDMAVISPNEGDLLSYDSVAKTWKNVPASSGGAGATNLTGLDDVNLVSPANDQVLSYNSSTSKWENKAAAAGAGGGGGGAGLPKIDWGSYAVTMDGQVDDEKDSNGAGYIYKADDVPSNNTSFDHKESLYDWDSDNDDNILLGWDYSKSKWKLIRGGDFLTRGGGFYWFYKRNETYSKAEVDAAISGGGGGGGGVPIGTIASWPFTAGGAYFMPDGWLLCNGAQVYQNAQNGYPDLFQVLGYKCCPGTMFNPNTGSFFETEMEVQQFMESFTEAGKQFCVPDLRNKILIGSDENTMGAYFEVEGRYSDPLLFDQIGSEIFNTHELTWNETNAGPTWTDWSKPWLGPNGVTNPAMPTGRTVSYMIKAA
jgi:hypothetical protein